MFHPLLRYLACLVLAVTVGLAAARSQGPPPGSAIPAGQMAPVRTVAAPPPPGQTVEHGPPAVQYFFALVCLGAVLLVVCAPSRRG